MTRHFFALCLSFLVATLSASSLPGDPRPSSEAAELAACKIADQLYSQGRFQEAAVKYDAALKLNNELECAQVGVAKTLAAQGNTAMAQNTINAALDTHLGSPVLLHTLGDIDFRLGEMGPAEGAYRAALVANPKDARSYLGLAQLYRAFSLYAHADAALKRAHELDPNDPEVLLLWIEGLPRRERLPALKGYLDGHSEISGDRRAEMDRYVHFLEKTQDQAHSCLPS